ncbi:MAG: VCBS repeat-containing protein [Candidatus Cyclonatronum sp.]|uniref:VCBS repeat-containing protein n=1 Tax=Cyclonatronum sp. TaxID=3024185 RepID=UPI0025C3BF67|nr:VCBS repeat-containing protein [Cyclonatronum sp.]MCH8486156.1 VCBS repeat-containing protein [Cyclonatronum sp.]
MNYSSGKKSAVNSLLPLFLAALTAVLFSCSSPEEPGDFRFERLDPQQTNLNFTNEVIGTPEFHILNYLYFYDGGGVAVGDLNNNGLPDIFLTANDGPNRLFQNLGDYRFEDITEQAGIIHQPGSWSTGVTMADITGNGYLDIYVSHSNYLVKSGRNQLFINNGDMTFTEMAADYGLDFEGYSTQAVFFDYNRNGRLDMFLLNHSFHSDRTHGQAERLRQVFDPKAGDRLFRNDGDRFTDVSQEAGIISSALGYGLGVAVTDINLNGWPDIYVGNDFHEDDYLYINNGDGTFTEMLYSVFAHTSRSSMGNDIADLTNNGFPDVFSLDMMSEEYEVYMTSGGPDLWPIAQTKRDFGFGSKNARNTLQINRGNDADGMPVFSEMAFSLGLARTEWSWAALLADFDNSGFKDVFVTNGMPHRPNDLDFVARLRVLRQQANPGDIDRLEFEAISMMPPVVVPNYMYRNYGGLQFEDVSREWGFGHAVVSNGAAYADLNNSGRLDLIVSNINEPARIYRNTTVVDSSANFLRVSLRGEAPNTGGIGSKVILYGGGQIFYQEQMPTRGFQSSVDHRLHFGLGSLTEIDSVLVVWPDWRYQTLRGVQGNAHITLHQNEAAGQFDFSRLHRSFDDARLRPAPASRQPGFVHEENRFNDFNREPLMPYKLSTQGPALAVADVTGNGLDDLYIGGAFRQPGRLFLQQSDGRFVASQTELFDQNALGEDISALFFDATGNGLPDLYVMTGGGQFVDNEEVLTDRLYINQGNGRFTYEPDRLPLMFLNGGVVKAADFTGNGAPDLFIGSRSVPWAYGFSPGSYLLANDGQGNFSNVTDSWYPDLPDIGMVTDAAWADLTGNGRPELIITGEWMSVKVLSPQDGRMADITAELGLGGFGGLWQHVRIADLTGNGAPDILLGNFGTNSRMEASPERPFHLLINEFGDDGRESAVMAIERNNSLYPFDRLEELLLEFPFLNQRVSSYRDFSTRDLFHLLGRTQVQQAKRKSVHRLESGAWLNDGNGRFSWQAFPIEAQAFPVFSSAVWADESGRTNVLLAGNLHAVKPGTGGKQGAGQGLHLVYDAENGFEVLTLQESGFFVRGETRHLSFVNAAQNRKRLIAVRNNDSALLFDLN